MQCKNLRIELIKLCGQVFLLRAQGKPGWALYQEDLDILEILVLHFMYSEITPTGGGTLTYVIH